MRKRSKHYCPKRVDIPMLVRAHNTLGPLDAIISQIARDGTVNCSPRGVPMFRDLETGQWFETAHALQGLIDHLEMYQMREQRSLPLQAMKEFHRCLEYSMPVSQGLLSRLQRDLPLLQRVIALSDPAEMRDLLRQVQIKELMEDAQ
ncbi:MAG: hypothetical protein AB7E12_00005 [Burkholderiaceae bacterium]